MQAKEGLPCSSQSQVVATITYQSLFRLFYKLSGMTGTAMTDYKVRHVRQDPFSSTRGSSEATRRAVQCMDKSLCSLP